MSNSDSTLCTTGTTNTVAPVVTISLDALLNNFVRIKKNLPESTGIIAVVKDCAYGCGALPISMALEEAGVDFFAIARITEAMSLREAGRTKPILLLGEASESEMIWASANNVHLAINDVETLHTIRRINLPQKLHLDIDTGMGRMGISPDQIPNAISILKNMPHGQLEGCFTHLACADSNDVSTTILQTARFKHALSLLAEAGIPPRYRHLANSAGIFKISDTVFNLARPGIMLYGCRPDPATYPGIPLEPIIRLNAPIVKVKSVAAGTPISYGWRYTTSETTTIVTIAIGYAHGLSRRLTNRGQVLIGGKRYTIAGTVTMDYIMVDAGPESTIKVGDEAVLIGEQGAHSITPDEMALHCETIGYEVLCGLSPRVERHYLHNSKIFLKTPGVLY